MPKPNIVSQLQSQVGMGRMGGMASLGSKPPVTSPGSKFAGMENAMLKKLKPDPIKMASGAKKAKQFNKPKSINAGQNAEGDQ